MRRREPRVPPPARGRALARTAPSCRSRDRSSPSSPCSACGLRVAPGGSGLEAAPRPEPNPLRLLLVAARLGVVGRMCDRRAAKEEGTYGLQHHAALYGGIDRPAAEPNLELYAAAYESLAEARDATVRAGKALMTVSRERSSYTYHSEDARRSYFLTPLDLPERDAYLATARRLTDIEVWSHIVAITDLERLMDKKAKDDFRRELQGEPRR